MDFEEINGRLRGVLISVTELSSNDADQIEALISAGEPGIALENLCTQLSEYDIPVSSGIVRALADIGTEMGISSGYWERLDVSA